MLSDIERDGFYFSTMLPNLIDSREQFPLKLETGTHELSAYDVRFSWEYPGTLEIAKDLGIKHPKVNGNGRSEPWVMSTDQLLTLKRPDTRLELLSIAYKPAKKIESKRTCELLEIERIYWKVRGADWLLITSQQYDERMVLTLRNTTPWALGTMVQDETMNIVSDVLQFYHGRPLSLLLQTLSAEFNCMYLAQTAFWQGVWSGRFPLEMRRGWRPHEPVQMIPHALFWQLNPIASRRSAWI